MTRQEFIQKALTKQKGFGWSFEAHPELFITQGMTIFSVNRDSTALDRSNWAVITRDLLQRLPKRFEIMTCNHWACGWVEHLLINIDENLAIDAVIEWIEKLADYPVADEDHYSNLQYEDAVESLNNWARHEAYQAIQSDNPECFDENDEPKGWVDTDAIDKVVVRLLINNEPIESITTEWYEILKEMEE